MRHLIDFGDLSRAEWDSLYHRCSEIMDHPADFLDACKGRVMASLFYEPSTRTNFSFQTAMLRVGGTVFFHSAQQVGTDPFLPQRIHQSRCFRHP